MSTEDALKAELIRLLDYQLEALDRAIILADEIEKDPMFKSLKEAGSES